MDQLSCLTCQTNLQSSNDQREHYKSEWHLYNLKRKLNQLKSINEDEFNQIKLKYVQNNNDNSSENPQEYYCDICGKSFLNQKAFTQHKQSNKHLKQMTIAAKLLNRYENNRKKSDAINVKQQKPQQNIEENNDKQDQEEEEFNESDWEEVNSDDDDNEILETIPIEDCLFCDHHSKDVTTNLSHMATEHSFFIPDLEYCIDIKGLLSYLGTKIADGHCCLWCSDHGKTFANKKSAQQHMIDVGHTKINFYNRNESLLEFEDFYDYSSSYPTDDGSKKSENVDEDDDNVDLNVLNDDDYELRLPSGVTIGHRSLMIYYKQKLRPQSQQQLVVVDRKKNKELINKIKHGYRMIGWNNDSNNGCMIKNQQLIRDMKYMNRLKYKMNLRLGQKSNLTKQSHFRCQMGFK